VKERIRASHQGVSLVVECDEQVYRPGILTSTLSDLMEVRRGDRAIDVGCGSGYLGIVASLLGASQVIGIDPVPEALRWTLHNASLNGIKNLTVIEGDALEPVANLHADLVLSNPPQIPYLRNFSSWRYGGADGTEVMIKVIKQASTVLRGTESRLFLIHSGLAYPAKVREAFLKSGYQCMVLRTLEKELNPPDFEAFAPGLTDYISDLGKRGMADLRERCGRVYYPIWFYRASLEREAR
jgi:methylase of polypeptide subunit release factors